MSKKKRLKKNIGTKNKWDYVKITTIITCIATVLTVIITVLTYTDNKIDKEPHKTNEKEVVSDKIETTKITSVTNDGEFAYKSLTTKLSLKNSNIDSSKRITESYIKIENINEIENSHLVILATQSNSNEPINIYAINNGQSAVKGFDINLKFADNENNYTSSIVSSGLLKSEDVNFSVDFIQPGEIKLIKSIVFDDNFISLMKNNDTYQISFSAETSYKNSIPSPYNDTTGVHSIGMIEIYGDTIYLDTVSKGGIGDEKTDYDQIKINVQFDKKKDLKIPFKSNPIVYDHLDLISEIFPDKSCYIEYSVHYILDGDLEICTDIMRAKILVPMYGQNFENEEEIDNYTDGLRLEQVINEYNITNYKYGQSPSFQNTIAYNRDIYSKAKRIESKNLQK